MNWQDIQKSLGLTPATTITDEPPSKGYTRVAGNVGKLGRYIQVPANLTNDVGYKRRLMFQINFSYNIDFYITNYKTLTTFGSMYCLGGCVCVKWRVNEIVYRYRLMDYRRDLNWSFFEAYAGQLVGKNFCIEFWQDDTNFAKGITQAFLMKTQEIEIPASIDDGDYVTEIDEGILSLADLTQPFPLVYPINYSNQAFITN